LSRPSYSKRIVPELVQVTDDLIDWSVVWDVTQNQHGEKATWWTQATAGVNYVRAEMPARHLPGKTVRFESRDIQPRGEGHFFPRQAGDAAVWMFPANVTKWVAMAEMHLQGLRVLVEVDDNYTVPSPTVGGLKSGWLSLRDKSGEDAHSFEAHRKIVSSKACHGVIVSTPKLGEVYERFGKPVFVCPNSVDPLDWDFPVEHSPDDVLRVGWAGSFSHAYDLADIRPALDWASRQPGVEIVILGQLDLGGIASRHIDWTDSLEEYRRNVSELDVILCPLRPSEWADCKSDVKALEGAMGLACPVVSKTEPFRPWWDWPYVAETPKDFTKIVKHLVLNRDETREAATKAREYALGERNIEQSITNWRRALEPNPPSA
jgi:hypothetical protein